MNSRRHIYKDEKTGFKVEVDMPDIEYINDFLYFVIKPYNSAGNNAFLYCSGVNVSRFSPLAKGRHGQGCNPVVRGLQLVRLGVADLALSQGAIPKKIHSNECAGIVPTIETWYTERLLIENAPETFPEEAINYSVINLLKKISKAAMLEEEMPDKLLEPDELQEFLEYICKKILAVKKV